MVQALKPPCCSTLLTIYLASSPTVAPLAKQLEDRPSQLPTTDPPLTTFEGLRDLQQLPAAAVRFLRDERFTLTLPHQDADQCHREKCALIVTFQALAAFERCLSSIKSSEKSFALSKLQSTLGIFVGSSWDAKVLTSIIRNYVDGRVNEILASLKRGKIPELPQDELLALLIRLIDRRIVFAFRRRFALPSSKDTVTAFSMCNQSCEAVSTALSKLSPNIFSGVGAMMNEGMRPVDLGSPWEDKAWLAENLGADFKLPETAKEDGEEEGHAAILAALDGNTRPPSVAGDKDKEGSVETTAAPNKRKRSDPESGEESEENEAAKRQKV